MNNKSKMSRYLIFQYNQYYPDGGMNDFVCSRDTIDECALVCAEIGDAQIFDTFSEDKMIKSDYNLKKPRNLIQIENNFCKNLYFDQNTNSFCYINTNPKK